MMLAEETSSPFTFLGSTDFKKTIDEVDGYVYYKAETYKASYTESSNLYLQKFQTIFTPGHTARQNGSKWKDGSDYWDYYLNTGYVHAEIVRAIDEENNKLGGNISLKAFWPQSSNVKTTITSSFGNSLTIGNNYSSGIVLGQGATLSLGGSKSTALGFNFTKSLSSVTDDPILSAQLDSSNSNLVQWNYLANVAETAGAVSYHLTSYILFEMDKTAKNIGQNAFLIHYNTEYINKFKKLWWHNGNEYKGGVNIYCFW